MTVFACETTPCAADDATAHTLFFDDRIGYAQRIDLLIRVDKFFVPLDIFRYRIVDLFFGGPVVTGKDIPQLQSGDSHQEKTYHHALDPHRMIGLEKRGSSKSDR